MTGYEGNKVFGINDKLSRADFVTILYRMEGCPPVTTSGSFSDVTADKYYSDAVEWAKEQKVITGYENTDRFGPADKITREQIATILWRLNGCPEVDYALTQPDANKISSWALEAVRWAVATKVINGKDGGTRIDPQGFSLRGETAQLIYNLLTVTPNDQGLLGFTWLKNRTTLPDSDFNDKVMLPISLIDEQVNTWY